MPPNHDEYRTKTATDGIDKGCQRKVAIGVLKQAKVFWKKKKDTLYICIAEARYGAVPASLGYG